MSWLQPYKTRLYSLMTRARCEAGDCQSRATTSRTLGDFDTGKEWTWRLCGKCAEWVDARWSHLITDSKEATR